MLNKKNKIIIFVTPLVFFLPVIIYAQSTDAEGVLDKILEALGLAVPVIIGLAVVMFLWGLLKFLVTTDESGRKEGKNFMLWGVIGLFVMVSVWGLVSILISSLQIQSQITTEPPLSTQTINIPE